VKKEEKNSIISFLIWLCITVFYCYQCVLRSLPNLIRQDLMSNFDIGAAEFGSFSGIYYIGYIILHIPIGLAITRLGARTILPICIGLTALGLIPLIYPISWNGALIGRVITGIGSSGAAVGALQIFRILYPTKFAMMLGLMVSVGLIIAVYLGNLIAPIILNIGIEKTFNVLLYSGLVLSVVTYFILPRFTEESSETNVLSDIKSVIFNYKILFTSFFAGLMVGPMEGFADAWGSGFLMNVYGIDKISADSLTLSILLGMSAGCVLLPYIADKTGYYFGTTIAAGVTLITCFGYILMRLASISSLDYICIIIGVCSAYQIVMISKIATFVSEERSGIAGAVANMIIMGFGWFFHNSIGLTLDSMWEGQMSDGVRQYTADAFIKSISIIPIAIIVAIIGLSSIAILSFVKAKKAKQS
jgi:MFS family permease